VSVAFLTPLLDQGEGKHAPRARVRSLEALERQKDREK